MEYVAKFFLFLCMLGSVASAFAWCRENTTLFYGTRSSTFVSRWGIQEICDHSFDPRVEAFPTNPDGVATFNPADVKRGDIIFVRDVCTFMKELHPHIRNSYIMVTAGDYKDAMYEEFIDFLDDEKIVAWFCVHPCPRVHPKFHALPLGIYQSREFYEKRGELAELFTLWRSTPKKKLLCLNFGLRPKFKPERDDIFAVFEHVDFCFKSKKSPFLEYMQEMSRFKFILSPRGLAPDTYRTWEAMLVGCIPILHTCYLDYLYADLPVLIVQDWTEITPEFLEKKYKEIISKQYNIEKLFMEYWWGKIEHIRKAFLVG